MSDGSTTLRGTPNPEAPNPQLPIVQRLRVRYAKRGRLRFTSHRDFGRAFERAVRRAQVPIAFSSGYTPHPKISFAGAAPTGAASEAEYLEIGLTEERDPDAVRAALDDALPPGIDVVEVVAARDGAGSLADRLEASEWVIELRGTPVEQVRPAVDAFFAPVAFRLQTYEPPVNAGARSYAAQLLALPSMKEWYAAALAETARDEPHEAEARAAGEWTAALRAR